MSDNLPARRDLTPVEDIIPILDSSRFEHMQRIAAAMAGGSLLPESLRMIKRDGQEIWLSNQEVMANCFMIVNQSVRWGMDPFAVAQCVSFVHGKICYEGKLIAALIEAKLGIRLRYDWNDKAGDSLGITVSGQYPDDPEPLTIAGTVGEWKTTGAGSPWGKMPRKMLAYRGAREWARLYAPALMLGVYSDDEMDDMVENARERRSYAAVSTAVERRPTLASRLNNDTGTGFSLASVEAEIGGGAPPAEPANEAAPAPQDPAADGEAVADPLEAFTTALLADLDACDSLTMLEAINAGLKERAKGDQGLLLAGKGLLGKRRRSLAEVADETRSLFEAAQ